MPVDTLSAALALPAGAELDALIELKLFGDDLTANTDERMELAMRYKASAYNCGEGLRVAVYKKNEHGLNGWSVPSILPFEIPERPGMHSPLYVWTSREGQPWQSALESHVASWRAPARPFSSDIALCFAELVPKMIEMDGHYVGIAWHKHEMRQQKPLWAVSMYNFGDDQYADTPALAICRAALAAAWENEDGST